MQMNEGTKQCPRCHLVKPIDDFISKKGNMKSQCKSCRSEVSKITNFEWKRLHKKPSKLPASQRYFEKVWVDMEQLTRVCSKCKQEKTIDHFGRCKTSYQSWCKQCTNEANKARNKKRYHEDAEYRRKLLDNKAKQIQEERKRAVEARSRQLRRQAGLED
jgi:hypothetical protein